MLLDFTGLSHIANCKWPHYSLGNGPDSLQTSPASCVDTNDQMDASWMRYARYVHSMYKTNHARINMVDYSEMKPPSPANARQK